MIILVDLAGKIHQKTVFVYSIFIITTAAATAMATRSKERRNGDCPHIVITMEIITIGTKNSSEFNKYTTGGGAFGDKLW
jgi:hypothetical protein